MKAIYRLSEGRAEVSTGEVAERLGVVPSTATAAVKRLAEQGLVAHRPYRGAALTAAGQEVAVGAIRRHRIVERFLADYLGYGWQDADRLATTFEADLPAEVEDRLYAALRQPEACPHGFPIPHPDADEIAPMAQLYDQEPGTVVEVAISGSLPDDVVAYLDGLGVRPGALVEVVDRAPFDGPLQILVAGVAHALGERLARQIHVKDVSPSEED